MAQADPDHGEDGAHLRLLGERLVLPEDGKDQDLGDHRDTIADNHVGEGLGQRRLCFTNRPIAGASFPPNKPVPRPP